MAKISQPAKKPVVNTQSIIQLAKKVRADLGDITPVTDLAMDAVPGLSKLDAKEGDWHGLQPGEAIVSHFKRFLDDDTRYDQFLCPAPTDSAISQYLDTCPY